MLTDDILSFADRLVSQSGILAKVTDFVLGSLISKTIAKAQCWASGWWCGDSNCLSACGEDIVQGIKYCYSWEQLSYDTHSSNCTQKEWCVDNCREGCWETAPCPTCACPA